MRFLALFALLPWTCVAGPGFLAQQFVPSGSPFAPTNNPGYNMVAWWPVWGGFTTNGNKTQLTDQWTNQYHLTNYDDLSSSFPVGHVATLNGSNTLGFNPNNNSWLRNTAYTNRTPSEIYMVVSMTNSVNEGYLFDSCTNYWGRQAAFLTNNGGFELVQYCGTATGLTGPDFTNHWVIWNFEFNGASSHIYSNGVSIGATSIGTQSGDGFMLGGKFEINFPAEFEVAEIGAYGTNLSASARTALVNYLATQYNLFYVAPPFNPTNLSGLAYRWTGGAVTQDTFIRWIDSVQNKIMQMDLPDTVHYTNVTGGGVWFDGSQSYGFHAAETAVTNWSIWLSMRPDTIDPAANAMFADENGVYLFRNNQAAVNIYLGGNNLFGNTVAAATGIDILATDNGTLSVYTNGVSAGSVAGKTNVFYFYVIGKDAYAAKISGKIYEIGVWTNTILSSINASNLHWYATNKYAY